MIEIETQIPKEVFSSGKIDKLIKELSVMIRSRFIQATPVDSGTARRSWTPVHRHSGGLSYSGGLPDGPVQRREIAYSFGNTAPYSHVLEKGSEPGKRPWPSTGPKTVLEDGRIFSSQAPGGIMATADIKNFIQKALPDLIRKYLD